MYIGSWHLGSKINKVLHPFYFNLYIALHTMQRHRISIPYVIEYIYLS